MFFLETLLGSGDPNASAGGRRASPFPGRRARRPQQQQPHNVGDDGTGGDGGGDDPTLLESLFSNPIDLLSELFDHHHRSTAAPPPPAGGFPAGGFPAGAEPPAPRSTCSRRVLERLPLVVVGPEDLAMEARRHCSVCWEEHRIRERAVRLPCAHLFHPDCVLPWLERSSCACPVCRYELPTDDPGRDLDRLRRMRDRRPQFCAHELPRLSVAQLRELGPPPLGCRDKADWVRHLVEADRIRVWPAPPPVQLQWNDLQSMTARQLKDCLRQAGIDPNDPTSTGGAVETSDVWALLLASDRVCVVGRPPEQPPTPPEPLEDERDRVEDAGAHLASGTFPDDEGQSPFSSISSSSGTATAPLPTDPAPVAACVYRTTRRGRTVLLETVPLESDGENDDHGEYDNHAARSEAGEYGVQEDPDACDDGDAELELDDCGYAYYEEPDDDEGVANPAPTLSGYRITRRGRSVLVETLTEPDLENDYPTDGEDKVEVEVLELSSAGLGQPEDEMDRLDDRPVVGMEPKSPESNKDDVTNDDETHDGEANVANPTDEPLQEDADATLESLFGRKRARPLSHYNEYDALDAASASPRSFAEYVQHRFGSWSVRQLRQLAYNLSVDVTQCMERRELAERLVDVLVREHCSDQDYEEGCGPTGTRPPPWWDPESWGASERRVLVSVLDLHHVWPEASMSSAAISPVTAEAVRDRLWRAVHAPDLAALYRLQGRTSGQLRDVARGWRVDASDCRDKADLLRRLFQHHQQYYPALAAAT